MPTYEFICPKCDYSWELNMAVKDYEKYLAVAKCPNCHYDEPKRLFNPVGFVLKGRGWFRDGYKSLNDEKKEAEYWAKKADPNFKE